MGELPSQSLVSTMPLETLRSMGQSLQCRTTALLRYVSLCWLLLPSLILELSLQSEFCAFCLSCSYGIKQRECHCLQGWLLDGFSISLFPLVLIFRAALARRHCYSLFQRIDCFD